jgi:hypothetical protein
MGLLPNSSGLATIGVTNGYQEEFPMMGQKVFQEKFFYNFGLSQRIPEEHILHRLDQVLDRLFVNLCRNSYEMVQIPVESFPSRPLIPQAVRDALEHLDFSVAALGKTISRPASEVVQYRFPPIL